MIPGDVLLPVENHAPLLAGDDTPPLGLISRERGPPVLNPQGGNVDLTARMWVAEYTGGAVVVYPEDTPAETTTLITASGISTVSLAFNQAGVPHIAYTQAGVAKLYWWDALVNQYTTLVLTGATWPILTMDDKRIEATLGNYNDIALFYIGAAGLCYRLQRERFDDEHVAVADVSGEITHCGLDADWRIQVRVQ